LPHKGRRIKNLELNAMVAGPSLQKYEHAQAAALQGLNVGEVEQNSMRVFLLGDSIAEIESSRTLNHPAFAMRILLSNCLIP
jgi:hypothetical protein